MKRALILIDLQNDFCPGGALAVEQGDQVIAVANSLIHHFYQRGEPIVATQDWHPASHGSFASNARQPVGESGELNGLQQIWWPDHCIQDTDGAAFHPALSRSLFDVVIHKGEDASIDSYSAFFDNGQRRQTALDNWLKARGVTSLVMLGLATDYCVKFSVIDALSLGYQVEVVREGCRGVNLHRDDSENALREMAECGARVK